MERSTSGISCKWRRLVSTVSMTLVQNVEDLIANIVLAKSTANAWCHDDADRLQDYAREHRLPHHSISVQT